MKPSAAFIRLSLWEEPTSACYRAAVSDSAGQAISAIPKDELSEFLLSGVLFDIPFGNGPTSPALFWHRITTDTGNISKALDHVLYQRLEPGGLGFHLSARVCGSAIYSIPRIKDIATKAGLDINQSYFVTAFSV